MSVSYPISFHSLVPFEFTRKGLSNRLHNLRPKPGARLLSSLLFFSTFLSIVTTHAAGPTIPELTQPVTDELQFLSQDGRIPAAITRINSKFSIQAAVYIPKSLQEYDLESFSLAVVEKWKLGKKGTDRGILILIAPTERKMRIEVGYGLEGEITDLYAKRILNETLRPLLREGKNSEAVLASLERIESLLDLPADKRADELSQEVKPAKNTRSQWTQLAFVLLLLTFVVRIGNRMNSRQGFRSSAGLGGSSFGTSPWGTRSSGWSSHSGGGGFSGGGGGFGGGGASSDW